MKGFKVPLYKNMVPMMISQDIKGIEPLTNQGIQFFPGIPEEVHMPQVNCTWLDCTQVSIANVFTKNGSHLGCNCELHVPVKTVKDYEIKFML
jgi:hypothetical protein